MTLKTLKDIDLNIDEIHDWDKPTAEEALRQEAIKWAKSIIENPESDTELHWMEIGQIAFIKVFFDLTEEDLK